MKKILFEEKISPNYTIKYGSKFELLSGHAGTKDKPKNCKEGWFFGDSTVILGYEAKQPDEPLQETVAEWTIEVPRKLLKKSVNQSLLIAAVRRFGGLHSGTYGSRVKIFINNKIIEDFSLKDIPSGHSDYFHRVPILRNLQDIEKLESCNTVYSWEFKKEALIDD